MSGNYPKNPGSHQQLSRKQDDLKRKLGSIMAMCAQVLNLSFSSAKPSVGAQRSVWLKV
jgi:hypothetical protein